LERKCQLPFSLFDFDTWNTFAVLFSAFMHADSMLRLHVTPDTVHDDIQVTLLFDLLVPLILIFLEVDIDIVFI
jgi:hypothetical protein